MASETVSNKKATEAIVYHLGDLQRVQQRLIEYSLTCIYLVECRNIYHGIYNTKLIQRHYKIN